MNAISLSLAKVTQFIDTLNQRRATGELLLASGDRQWQLYFFQGQLFYATSSVHRVRRWQRALRCHCPNFAAEASYVSQPWEYHLLNQGIIQGQLSADRVQQVIHTSLVEVFFDLVNHSDAVTSRWQTRKPLAERSALPETQQVLQTTQNIWEQWQAKNLGKFSPNLAPVLKQSQQGQAPVSSEATLSLTHLINGQNTIWDIAYQLRQPLWAVMFSLLCLVRRNLVELTEVPDLPPDVSKESVSSSTPNLSQPLIACIDDSPAIAQSLEKILSPAGYRVLKVMHPLREMSNLVKQRPNLIFLDLIMPDTNGYNLCSFLRKTPTFQETPIIILTGRDNIVDRTRAKLAGTSDFLAKPPNPEQVLQAVQKYLAAEETQKRSLTVPAAPNGARLITKPS